MSTTACMGGWCAKRDHCAHYHAAAMSQTPAERLCPPGKDGAGLATLQELDDMPQVHIPLPERLASIMALITPAGVSTNEITAAMGFKTRSRTSVLMRKLVADGKVFHAGAGNTAQRYFLTTEDRDAYAIQYRAEMAERRLANCAAASRRYRMSTTVELPSMRVRQQDAKEAKQQRVKAETKKTQKRLKAETKAAGALVFKPGTEVARPKKVAWADLPVNNPNGVKPVELVNSLRGRYAVDNAPSVITSSECRPWAAAAAMRVEAVA